MVKQLGSWTGTLGFIMLAGVGALAVSCSSSNGGTNSNGATCDTPGGPVAGTDAHCGSTVVTVDPHACNGMGGAGGMGAMGGMAGGNAGAGGMMMPEYGPTMVGSAGDDDDCKYHFAWTSTPICEGGGVTVTAKVTAKADGKPVTGAAPALDVFLTETHVAPGLGQIEAHETEAGTYTLGPIDFDEPGRWTIRFHLFELMCDTPTSPHGHAAFYVDVP